MKRIGLAVVVALGLASTAAAQDFEVGPVCKVQVCNKLERFSLDIWSHLKDKMGEMCHDVVIPKEDAVEGKILSSESRWYQGSTFNPTKQSITRVKQVYGCQEDPK